MPKRAWFGLAAAGLFLISCGDDPPEDWVARVESFSGPVTVQERPRAIRHQVTERQYLTVGARLETGEHAHATLGLRNGGRLTVEPGSVVTLGGEGGELGLELERGRVVGETSEVEASDLVIGVGDQKFHLPAQAKARVEVSDKGMPSMVVLLGRATVEGPKGERRTIVVGREFVLAPAPAEPDASLSDAGDDGAIVARPLTYHLKAVRGRVSLKGPDDRSFSRMRRGRSVVVAPGTEVKLQRRAEVLFGPKEGEGAVITGPGRFEIGRLADADKPTMELRGLSGALKLSDHGEPQMTAAPLEVEGVRIRPLVRHRRVELELRRERQRAVLAVKAGGAKLQGDGRSVEVEAGQQAVLRGGRIAGPQSPPLAPLQIRTDGTTRVFTNDRRIPLTLRWKAGEKAVDHLVEVSRHRSLRAPLFSDRIRRRVLTLPQVPRGSIYWRVRPVDSEGEIGEPVAHGRLALFRDTSHRLLSARRIPRNTIHTSYRDTVVYYQNRLPRFTFRWPAVPGAASYRLKVFSESNLSRPLLTKVTRDTAIQLPSGKLQEGTYLWYVTSRGSDGKLIESSKERKLGIRYDNATPDLQIKGPRNDTTVSEESIVTSGVTIPGSKVFVNGQQIELDKTYRFEHSVGLKPGTNYIIYRVVDRRRGSSYYMRRVLRQ